MLNYNELNAGDEIVDPGGLVGTVSGFTNYPVSNSVKATFGAVEYTIVPEDFKYYFKALVNCDNTPVKQDSGKLRYDLLPFDAVDEVVRVLNYGVNKYPKPEENWRHKSSKEDIKRYEAALLRHMSLHMQGELIDLESGLPHIAQIATNALFIIALRKKYGCYEGKTTSDPIGVPNV